MSAGTLAPTHAMPSPDLSTPLPSTSEPDDPPARSMESPAYPSAGAIGSPAFPSRPQASPPYPSSRGLDSLSLLSRTSDNLNFPTKSESPPPAFPPRNMDMPYGHRLLPDHPMGYSGYQSGSFPPSSGPYGPPPVSFGSLPPSFNPGSLTPSLTSAAGGFPSTGATGSPPLEAFVQLLLAMNVEDQLKVGHATRIREIIKKYISINVLFNKNKI